MGHPGERLAERVGDRELLTTDAGGTARLPTRPPRWHAAAHSRKKSGGRVVSGGFVHGDADANAMAEEHRTRWPAQQRA